MRPTGTALAALLVGALAGCLRSGTSTCDDGRVCPSGTVCIKLIEGTGDPHRCVDADHIGCAGADTHATCDGGVCYAGETGGVCLAPGCANSLLDTAEQCDDGNNLPGDGCSADCTSDERCGNGLIDPIASEQCDDSGTLSYDGCSGQCEIELPRWTSTAWHIGALTSSAVAYDVARRRAVLFGGGVFVDAYPNPPDILRGDTYEWDGVSWIRRQPRLAPSPRYGHAMVYDAARRRMVMFGGREQSDLNDTWEWDGDSWANIDTPPPPTRSFHGMAYDSRRKRVVVFGGQDDGVELDDTWEFDGTTWTEITSAVHPAARSQHVMAFDPERGVVVVAGGTQTNDTWEYDGAWRATSAQLPLVRSAAAFDFATRHIVAFGGRTRANAATNLTRSYDGQQWTVLPSQTSPTVREIHALVGDPIALGLLVTPGADFTDPSMNYRRTGTWRWSGTTWQLMPELPAPPPRVSTAIAFDPVRRRTLMFGGFDGTNISDTWLLDNETWRSIPAQPVGQQPSGRSGQSMAYDTKRDQAVLFGGYDGTAYVADTWRWNGAWSKANPSTPPPGRGGAAMVFDSARSRTVLFGGSSTAGLHADTWEWDGTNWTLAAMSGPPATNTPVLGYDPIRRRTVLFTGDTWEWDGVSWTQRMTSASPPVTTDAPFTWNAARGTLVLQGGRTPSGFLRNMVWEWNGTRWREVEVEASPQLANHEGFPHPSGAGVAFIVSTGVATELLQLSYSGHGATYESCVDDVDLDGDGQRGCADTDCWVTCAPLCSPATTCDPAASRCGDGACNAALENCRLCPGDCGACAPVCGDFVCDPGESCLGDC